MTVTPPPRLLAAVRRGDEKAALELLDADCYGDVDAIDERLQDGSALFWAASRGMVTIARRLMQLGANLAARSGTDCTPLHAASDSGQPRVMKVLLKGGADVRLRNMNGSTPAHLAAFRGNAECLRILLHAGSDVMALDDAGKTVYTYGMLNGNRDVRDLVQGAKDRSTDCEKNIRDLPWTLSPEMHKDIIQPVNPQSNNCPSLTLTSLGSYQTPTRARQCPIECTVHCPVHCPVHYPTQRQISPDFSVCAFKPSHGNQLELNGAAGVQCEWAGYADQLT